VLGVDLGSGPDLTAFQTGTRKDFKVMFAWETIGVVRN